MSYVNFNRALTRAQIEALGHGDPSDSSYEEATNGKIYFAKDGGIYVGNSNGTADRKADFTPLMEKTWDPYTCASTAEGDSRLALFVVHPTSDTFQDPWYVHYRILVTTPEAISRLEADVYISQSGANFAYSSFNILPTTSYAVYFHEIYYHNTEAMYANKDLYPLKVGVRIQSGYKVNTLSRTFTIQIFDYRGCEVELLDNIQKQSEFYSATNYARTELNALAVGLQETSDQDTQVAYGLRDVYPGYEVHSQATQLFRYKFCGFDLSSRIIPISLTNVTSTTATPQTACSVPMVVSKGLVYYSTTGMSFSAPSTRTAGYNIYRYLSNCTSLVYNFSTLPTLNQDVYLKGSYNPITDEFTLDTTDSYSYYVFITQGSGYENLDDVFEEGYYYWYLGYQTNQINQFMFTTEHPLFVFKDGNLTPVIRNEVDKYLERDIEFIKRPVLTDGQATIESIKGNAAVWNQLAPYSLDNWEYNTGWDSVTQQDGVITLTTTTVSSNKRLQHNTNLPLANQHILYLALDIKASRDWTSDPSFGFGTQANNSNTSGQYINLGNLTTEWQRKSGIVRTTNINTWIGFVQNNINAGNIGSGITFYLRNIQCIDLTAMFGTGCEPSIAEFKSMYPDNDYGQDDGGWLYTNVAETINSYDSSLSLVDSTDLPSLDDLTSEGVSLSTYFPNGLSRAGYAVDEITHTKAIKRVARVNLGDLDWGVQTASTGIFRVNDFDITYGYDKTHTTYPSLMSNLYMQRIVDSSASNLQDRQMLVGVSDGRLYVRKSSFANQSADVFKAAMDGVYLYYELATPVEYPLDQTWECKYNVVEGGYEQIDPTTGTAPFRGDITYKIAGGTLTSVPIGDAEDPDNSWYTKTQVDNKLLAKQNTLVSGTNIKTIGGQSILGPGNIEVGGTFYAVYGTTTYADVLAAYNAGKLIFCVKSNEGLVFELIRYDGSSEFIFTGVYVSGIYDVRLKSTGWTISNFYIQDAAAKSTTIVGRESSDVYYPTTKAVADYATKKIILSVDSGEYIKLGGAGVVQITAITEGPTVGDMTVVINNGAPVYAISNNFGTLSNEIYYDYREYDYVYIKHYDEAEGFSATVQITLLGSDELTAEVSSSGPDRIGKFPVLSNAPRNTNYGDIYLPTDNSNIASPFLVITSSVSHGEYSEGAYMVSRDDNTGDISITFLHGVNNLSAEIGDDDTSGDEYLHLSASDTIYLSPIGTGRMPIYIDEEPDDWNYDTSLNIITLEKTSNKTTTISSSSTNTQYPSAKCLYDTVYPTIGTTQGTGMVPNKLYNLGTLTGAVTFTFASPTDNNIVNHYYWTFETGSTAPTVTFPASITSWLGGSTPTINANKHYEISVLNGIGCYMEV